MYKAVSHAALHFSSVAYVPVVVGAGPLIQLGGQNHRPRMCIVLRAVDAGTASLSRYQVLIYCYSF